MNKIYQPIVERKYLEILEILNEVNYFEENEIENMSFVEGYLKDKLTEKFILGELSDEDNADYEIFTYEEYDKILREMLVGSILYELKDKGYINSYSDENTEEMFFLTPDGKEYMNKKIKN
jgi:DNA-binding PadR family transcriptional regulator